MMALTTHLTTTVVETIPFIISTFSIGNVMTTSHDSIMALEMIDMIIHSNSL